MTREFCVKIDGDHVINVGSFSMETCAAMQLALGRRMTELLGGQTEENHGDHGGHGEEPTTLPVMKSDHPEERHVRFGSHIVKFSKYRARLIQAVLKGGNRADHATIGDAVWGNDLVESHKIRDLVRDIKKQIESADIPVAPTLVSEDGDVYFLSSDF